MSLLSNKTDADARDDGSAHWISVSDLMSALMMIFLLIAVFYMISHNEDKKAQAMDREAYLSKNAHLEEATVLFEKRLLEKDARLAQTEEDYQKLLIKAGNLEGELAGSEKLLGEKSRMLDQTRAQYRALVSQFEDTQKLLAETASRLKASQMELVRREDKGLVSADAVVYDDVIQELHETLLGEFSSDFRRWNAELRDDLTFRFNEPTVLFDVGQTTIKPEFQEILDDFFPRYMQVITSDKFRKDIAEVRIEGHTSSFWNDLPPDSKEAYFNNMQLSQGRSRSTLYYVMTLPVAEKNTGWLKSRLTANGLSSSKPVDKNGYFLTDERSDGKENYARSQRVEFRVRIDAESKITKLAKADA